MQYVEQMFVTLVNDHFCLDRRQMRNPGRASPLPGPRERRILPGLRKTMAKSLPDAPAFELSSKYCPGSAGRISKTASLSHDVRSVNLLRRTPWTAPGVSQIACTVRWWESAVPCPCSQSVDTRTCSWCIAGGVMGLATMCHVRGEARVWRLRSVVWCSKCRWSGRDGRHSTACKPQETATAGAR